MTSNNAHTLIICQHCGTDFHAMRVSSRYCSDACKQAAYRQRKDPTTNTAAKRNAGIQSAITKAKQRTEKKTCKHCGESFIVDGHHTLQQYCSKACRQAQYRNGNERRSPRQILVDDALLTLRNDAAGFWNLADSRQIFDMVNTLAKTRGGKVLNYWTTAQEGREAVYFGPAAQLVGQVRSTVIYERLNARYQARREAARQQPQQPAPVITTDEQTGRPMVQIF